MTERVATELGRAEVLRLAVLEARYMRGRLAKVTTADYEAILTVLDSLPGAAAQADTEPGEPTPHDRLSAFIEGTFLEPEERDKLRAALDALTTPTTVHLVVRAGCDHVMAVHSTAVEAYADRRMRERGREPGAYQVESWRVLDAVPSYAELRAEGATR